MMLLLLSLMSIDCLPIAECDVGSYKLCFFAHLNKIGAASYNTNKLITTIPKSHAVDIKASLPDFISYWTRSPDLVIVNDDEFKFDADDRGLTVVIESP